MSGTLTSARGQTPVSALIDRWEHDGLVSAEQARALRDDVAEHPPAEQPAPPTESVLTEALSYLGGVLVLVAGGLLTARLWEDLPFVGRVLLAAAATAVLLGSGLLVPARLGPAGQRVRRLLWLLSTATFAGLLVVLAVDGLDLEGAPVGVLASGGTAVYAAVLWHRERSALQSLALFVALAALAATTGIWLLDDREGVVPGLAVLGTSVLWGVAARRRLVAPQDVAMVEACAGALLGATIVTGDRGWGHLLAVAVVLGVVVLAVRFGDLVLLAVATGGALLVLPRAVAHFFPSVVGAALVLLAAGAGLIASGLVIAGRRAKRPAEG